MMKKLLSLALVAVFAPAAMATVIVDEDFESYATTAAMQANWNATGLGTLDTGFGHPGQSMSHPGGTDNQWIGSAFSVSPTVGNAVVLTADMYDDGASQNKRMSVGLRGGPFPLFEMGNYNSGEHYYARINSMYGNENWIPITTISPVQGWHRWTATFQAWKLTIELDLQSDGIVDARYVSEGSPNGNFFDLRLGGPSSLSSGGGGVSYDNIKLESNVLIPEPASMALLALGGLVALRRRR